MKKILSYLLIGTISLSMGALVSCQENKPTPKFAINVTAATNGNTITATINNQPVVEAKKGETITLTATPAEGWNFINWVVSNNVTLIGEANELSVTFKMPASAVTISAEFQEPAVIEPINYIKIDGGEKQEILASAYAFVEGEGYAFAFSPMDLTDRSVTLMEKRLEFFIPVELMDTEIDMAVGPTKGAIWDLVVNLYKEFLDKVRIEDETSSGTFKISKGTQTDSFVIDFTDFTFKDGTKVSMHYEGVIDKKDYETNFIQYTAVLATWDVQFGEESVNKQTTGYIQHLVGEDDGVMISNIWSYIGDKNVASPSEPYAFFDVYLFNPDGGVFTDGVYNSMDYTFSELCFDGGFEAAFKPVLSNSDYAISDLFMEESGGTITFSRTATSFTITFSDVLTWEEFVINGTVTCDVTAPLTSAAPAFIPNKAKKFGRK